VRAGFLPNDEADDPDRFFSNEGLCPCADFPPNAAFLPNDAFFSKDGFPVRAESLLNDGLRLPVLGAFPSIRAFRSKVRPCVVGDIPSNEGLLADGGLLSNDGFRGPDDFAPKVRFLSNDGF
jgi:hypothetical protein